jgi:hypothetical protein
VTEGGEWGPSDRSRRTWAFRITTPSEVYRRTRSRPPTRGGGGASSSRSSALPGRGPCISWLTSEPTGRALRTGPLHGSIRRIGAEGGGIGVLLTGSRLCPAVGPMPRTRLSIARTLAYSGGSAPALSRELVPPSTRSQVLSDEAGGTSLEFTPDVSSNWAVRLCHRGVRPQGSAGPPPRAPRFNAERTLVLTSVPRICHVGGPGGAPTPPGLGQHPWRCQPCGMVSVNSAVAHE